MALPRGAMGLSAVYYCGIPDHIHLLFLSCCLENNFHENVLEKYIKKVG